MCEATVATSQEAGISPRPRPLSRRGARDRTGHRRQSAKPSRRVVVAPMEEQARAFAVDKDAPEDGDGGGARGLTTARAAADCVPRSRPFLIGGRRACSGAKARAATRRTKNTALQIIRH